MFKESNEIKQAKKKEETNFGALNRRKEKVSNKEEKKQ